MAVLPIARHSPIMFGAHLIGIYEYDVLNCRERLVETQLRPAIVVHRRWDQHFDDDDGIGDVGAGSRRSTTDDDIRFKLNDRPVIGAN